MNLRIDKSRITDPTEIVEIINSLVTDLNTSDIVLVKNPSYIYSPLEIYPLAPKIFGRISGLVGIAKDMDGTTTTTEPLCLHSLEWMIRRITDRLPGWSKNSRSEWAGLDKDVDYPHIIGNSTTKHVEYLVKRYENEILVQSFCRSYIESALWTLIVGKDPGRRNEVKANISTLGLDFLWEQGEIKEILESNIFIQSNIDHILDSVLETALSNFNINSLTNKVRAAVDIYYMRYHSILMDISEGKGRERSKELLNMPGKRLVEAMPGVGILISLVKGWLGEDIINLKDILLNDLHCKGIGLSSENIEKSTNLLAPLGLYFQNNPVKIAIVTSSIAYEADIVLTEVFSVIREQIASWPISAKKKEFLIEKFSSYKTLYDAFITATDSSEIRLKPHRDLYSIALHQMGIPKEKYSQVAGFEDSESGTIAIRAAGIGLCLAVPFADTAGHDLSAATHILHGQLPEYIFVHQCFLQTELLDKYRK